MASIAADQISKLCPCSSRVEDIRDPSGDERRARMGGSPEDLTFPQEEALNKFRAVLTEHGLLLKRDTDSDLIRFLRARSFDVSKARAMYESMVEWRRMVGADTIRETFDFPERNLVKSMYPHFHHKTDKLGRPLYIEKLGQLQVDDLMKLTTMERMMLYHIQEWEILIDTKFPACSKRAGKTISQSLAILDLKGVTMKHMSKQVRHFIQNISKVDQDYYPEYLGKMFIVNAPMAFKAIWAMIKPWLDKRTQKKIEVHGSNYTSKLLEFVDKENLPEFLGGTCRCPEGCEYADAGPWKGDLPSEMPSKDNCLRKIPSKDTSMEVVLMVMPMGHFRAHFSSGRTVKKGSWDKDERDLYRELVDLVDAPFGQGRCPWFIALWQGD